jgi:hypothetical protein
VIRVCLAADGRLEDEAFVDLWIDVDVVFVGHGHPLRFDHVLLASLVASVEDQTVALWSKRYECDPYRRGSSSSPDIFYMMEIYILSDFSKRITVLVPYAHH